GTSRNSAIAGGSSSWKRMLAGVGVRRGSPRWAGRGGGGVRAAGAGGRSTPRVIGHRAGGGGGGFRQPGAEKKARRASHWRVSPVLRVYAAGQRPPQNIRASPSPALGRARHRLVPCHPRPRPGGGGAFSGQPASLAVAGQPRPQ